MDLFTGLISGFQIVFSPLTLFYCFVGVFIGTLIGVLPGIGPAGTIAILLPATYGMSPVSAIILLAGIYYGAMYGGSTTSILVNIPGESASIVTCLDGYQMARQGRAGPALGISAFGSFIGGTFSIIALMFLVFPLARAAMHFGPPEYFAVVCMGMSILIYMARGSVVKAVIMIWVGFALSFPGIDSILGMPRFTFGSVTLLDGIGLVPLAMGVFGISELLLNVEGPMDRIIFKSKIKNLLPDLKDWKRSAGPITRASLLGFFVGILPGAGAVIPTFISYSIEKKISKHPEEFGKGAIEGVAGPETANNSAAGGAFVPMLALGIPPTPTLALLLGGLIIHGVAPGPLLISQHPEVFWGTICSMYIGNGMLLLLNLPLIGMWVKLLQVPYRILMPFILLFCLIGAYSLNYNIWDVVVMTILGILGFILRKFDYEMAPMILAFVLGPMLETAFRQSLIMSDGKFTIFLERPISGVCIGISALLFISTSFSSYRKTKKKVMVFSEETD